MVDSKIPPAIDLAHENDTEQIHAPWLVPPPLLEQKGIRLGRDYPAPIADHAEARARTLERYAVVKSPGA